MTETSEIETSEGMPTWLVIVLAVLAFVVAAVLVFGPMFIGDDSVDSELGVAAHSTSLSSLTNMMFTF